MNNDLTKNQIPVWVKTTLTVEETAELTGLPVKLIRKICYQHPELVITMGVSEKRHPKILIKRRLFEDFVEKASSFVEGV